MIEYVDLVNLFWRLNGVKLRDRESVRSDFLTCATYLFYSKSMLDTANFWPYGIYELKDRGRFYGHNLTLRKPPNHRNAIWTLFDVTWLCFLFP